MVQAQPVLRSRRHASKGDPLAVSKRSRVSPKSAKRVPARDSGSSELINLALQGGGAHGAFTWGVLDRLLEEPWLEIEAVSGTSAGAMNAAVMASGHAKGGNEAARAALDAYWRRVSDAAAFSPLRRSPIDVLLGRWSLDHSPVYVAFDLMARVFSPYDLAFPGGPP